MSKFKKIQKHLSPVHFLKKHLFTCQLTIFKTLSVISNVEMSGTCFPKYFKMSLAGAAKPNTVPSWPKSQPIVNLKHSWPRTTGQQRYNGFSHDLHQASGTCRSTSPGNTVLNFWIFFGNFDQFFFCYKKSKFLMKIGMFVKKLKFGSKFEIFLKIRNLVRNRNFRLKSKCSSNIKVFVKIPNFLQKSKFM